MQYAFTFSFSCIAAAIYQNRTEIKVREPLYKKKNNKAIYYFIILFFPIIMAAFRKDIGADYQSYVSIFKEYQNINFLEGMANSKEPFYTVLNYVADVLFGSNEWGIFLLSSSIMLLIILKTADYYRKDLSIAASLLIFYIVYYIESFNLVRQMLAVSCVVYSFRYLIERNFFKYMVGIIIGSLFHNTALIAILFYLIPYRKYKKNSFTKMIFPIFILLLPLALNYLIHIFSKIPIFNYYFSEYDVVKINFGLGFFMDIGTAVLPVLFFRKNIIAKNPRYEILINIILLSIPLKISSYFVAYVWRLVYYSTSAQIILVPIIINLVRNDKEKKLFKIIIIIMYISYFVYYYIIRRMGPGIPYTSVFL